MRWNAEREAEREQDYCRCPHGHPRWREVEGGSEDGGGRWSAGGAEGEGELPVALLEMIEDESDDVGVVDGGDDLHRPATVLAGLDVDVEHALEALRRGATIPLVSAQSGQIIFLLP